MYRKEKLHRQRIALVMTGLSALLLAGCGQQGESAENSAQEEIPFEEGQLYAVAHIGYQEITGLEDVAPYLCSTQVPVHYVSDGDFYLIIPREDTMDLTLFKNDMETGEKILFYEEPNCSPFILQCNVSDIFNDVTVRLTCGEEETEFSPFISLKDGSLDIGSRGLNLTP